MSLIDLKYASSHHGRTKGMVQITDEEIFLTWDKADDIVEFLMKLGLSPSREGSFTVCEWSLYKEQLIGKITSDGTLKDFDNKLVEPYPAGYDCWIIKPSHGIGYRITSKKDIIRFLIHEKREVAERLAKIESLLSKIS